MGYWIERKAFFLGDGVYFGGCGRRRGDIGWFSGRVWSIVRTHAIGEFNQDCLFCRLKDATTETEGGRKNPSPFLQNTACTFKRKKGFHLEEHHIFIFEVVKF